MAWYDQAVFYHIYPIGLTDAPKQNPYAEPEHRLNTLLPWISHIKKIGCNALYIGPLFESVGHGYETTDYKKLDSRLGTNDDLTNFVKECHKQEIKVIFDGVFNHVGRDFFAFKDLKQNREHSPYTGWFCNVNFYGNNEYNDGFCYDNWGGHNLLVKLNQKNPAVRDYICDVIRYWVAEFDIDGIRLDAADVLDFEYMQAMRRVANEVKEDFWLMGEVIHGDYSRWANENTLHSVTNYQLHKALYSGHNDHNYFEIAHTIKYLSDKGLNQPGGLKLYNFVDNHDVERIYTKLQVKKHFIPVHILMYTLPGIPSVYYGSEFAIDGKKEYGSDYSLRPALSLADYADAVEKNEYTKLIASLGTIRQKTKVLSYGDYKQLLLTNRQFAFSRNSNGWSVIIAVNNDDNESSIRVPTGNAGEYIGALSGKKVTVQDGHISFNLPGNSGEIWIPANMNDMSIVPVLKESAPQISAAIPAEGNKAKPEPPKAPSIKPEEETSSIPQEAVGAKATNTSKQQEIKAPEPKKEPQMTVTTNKSYEEMTVEELQNCILAKMAKNGPVTDQMKKDVMQNIWHNSLVTWAKSF